MGVRPEHIVIGGSATPISANVEVVENLGGTRYLYCTARSGESLIVEAREQPGIKAGDRLDLGLRPDRVMAFSGEGKRLRSA